MAGVNHEYNDLDCKIANMPMRKRPLSGQKKMAFSEHPHAYGENLIQVKVKRPSVRKETGKKTAETKEI